ncbi:UPF0449 protein C19orf25 like protein [Trichuris trichiura]|uniref:UPF0449 protein C19orf25 like protein n=1 Tax=Trichuris trichiura TaxID=36087 RepID=A0A077ZHA1_TRITR|nr:UPF0449 protein C19orf25 like protein [Trichuris trichiura]
MSNSIPIPEHIAESVQVMLASLQENLPAPPEGDLLEEDLHNVPPNDPLLTLITSPSSNLDLPSEFVEAFNYASRCRRLAQLHTVKAGEVDAELESCKMQIETITRLLEETESLIRSTDR